MDAFFKDGLGGDVVDKDTCSDAIGVGVHFPDESVPGLDAFFKDGLCGDGVGVNNSVGKIAGFNNACLYRSGVNCVFNLNTSLFVFFF